MGICFLRAVSDGGEEMGKDIDDMIYGDAETKPSER
jgi:hypothetical protein